MTFESEKVSIKCLWRVITSHFFSVMQNISSVFPSNICSISHNILFLGGRDEDVPTLLKFEPVPNITNLYLLDTINKKVIILTLFPATLNKSPQITLFPKPPCFLIYAWNLHPETTHATTISYSPFTIHPKQNHEPKPNLKFPFTLTPNKIVKPSYDTEPEYLTENEGRTRQRC